ncbi:hypothetical protein IAR55_000326 [Kwoniella newhampshirensis]|uniref:Uncharacterized protein n=1 Tax=Kwoniella newhampshirensis TaxID=1651941 RepID=A0AAW0Z6F0_9TREE
MTILQPSAPNRSSPSFTSKAQGALASGQISSFDKPKSDPSGPELDPDPVLQSKGQYIIGHTVDANRAAALSLKTMLSHDEDVKEQGEIDLPRADSYQLNDFQSHKGMMTESEEGSESRKQSKSPVQRVDDIYVRAFHREYSQPRCEKRPQRERGGLILPPDDAEAGRSNIHSSNSPFPLSDLTPDGDLLSGIPLKEESSSTPSNHFLASRVDKSKSHRGPPQRLRLQGLEKGRSRNGYGKCLQGGQGLGIGVIGGPQPQEGEVLTTTVATEAGCDIPMMRGNWSEIRAMDENQTHALALHQVSLDPDLPPLAIEHPARVWNSMIHSLDPDLQPIIKWDYEKMSPEAEGGETLWLAHLTLILPPTHPTISEHPLFRTLPKNRYKREYVSALEAIGGVKKWTGSRKKLKADAQNTTLVKCVSEDALAWIYAPHGLSVVPASDDEEEDNLTHSAGMGEATNPRTPAQPELQQPLPMHVLRDTSMSNRLQGQINRPGVDQQDPPASMVQVNGTHITAVDITNEIQIDEENLASPTPSSGHPPIFTPPDTLPRFEAVLNRTLGPGGLNLTDPAVFTTTRKPATAGHGCTLTVGTSADFKIYEEGDLHSSPEEACNAVCQRAFDLNVEGFMEWLREMLTAPLPENVVMIAGQPFPEQAADHNPSQISTHAVTQRSIAKGTIDWQAQLAAFCKESGLQAPRCTQKVERLPSGKPMFVGQVTIEDDVFCLPVQHPTIMEARQDVARRVLIDHFGQTPK